MRLQIAWIIALASLATSTLAHAARGDRARARSLGDALVRGLTDAHYLSKPGRRQAPTLPVVQNPPYGLAAVEPGQGNRTDTHRVETLMKVGHDAWGVDKAMATLPPGQRAKLATQLTSGPVTLRWNSRTVLFYDWKGDRRHALVPSSMRATHTLTLTPDQGADHEVVIHPR